jgi:hypothetical protein
LPYAKLYAIRLEIGYQVDGPGGRELRLGTPEEGTSRIGSIRQFGRNTMLLPNWPASTGLISSLPEALLPTPRITSGAQLLNRAVVGQDRSENRPDEFIVLNTAQHKLRYEHVDDGVADVTSSPRYRAAPASVPKMAPAPFVEDASHRRAQAVRPRPSEATRSDFRPQARRVIAQLAKMPPAGALPTAAARIVIWAAVAAFVTAAGPRFRGCNAMECQRALNRDPGFSPNRDPLVTGANGSGRPGGAGSGCAAGASAGQ